MKYGKDIYSLARFKKIAAVVKLALVLGNHVVAMDITSLADLPGPGPCSCTAGVKVASVSGAVCPELRSRRAYVAM